MIEMTELPLTFEHVLVDYPAPAVMRVTLNRPEKRNALSNPLRADLFQALEHGDMDPQIRVMIVKGAGSAFCAGYDLAAHLDAGRPWYTAGGLGSWPRHVTEGCFRIWDMAKPVIGQVHGYCLAGGTELAAACDLLYVGESAKIGYPAVRAISPPDNQFFPWMIGMRRSMELMLTGDSISGQQAVEYGFANDVFEDDELDAAVLAVAERVAKIPPDIQQINKRAMHRQMDAMGIRAAVRAGTEMQALAMQTASTQAYLTQLGQGVTAALSQRDGKFGDYRTSDQKARET
jgi:enoyl-CoA hydratase